MGRREKPTAQQALDLARAGVSIKDIASSTGYSEAGLRFLFMRHDVPVAAPRATRKPRVHEHHARMVEMAEAGSSISEIAKATGYSYCGVRNVLTRFGVQARRQGRGLRDADRAEAMASMYRQGLPLEKIGQKFGVTRERARQILKAFGITSTERPKRVLGSVEAKRARMDAASLVRWGVPYAAKKAARADGTLAAFVSQRNNAKSRGIEWKLMFADWLTIWHASGKLALRGRGKGRYVMSRINDEGGYRIGNVHIQESVENNREGLAKCRGNKAKKPGVYLIYPGLSKPWVVYSRKGSRLGSFATEEEAIAARLTYERDSGNPSPVRGRGYAIVKYRDGSLHYQVQVGRKYVGTFKTPEEALAARATALETKVA